MIKGVGGCLSGVFILGGACVCGKVAVLGKP